MLLLPVRLHVEALDMVVAPEKEEAINRMVKFAAPIGQTHWLSVCTSMKKTAASTTSTILGDSQ
jgi:hypothetical protein